MESTMAFFKEVQGMVLGCVRHLPSHTLQVSFSVWPGLQRLCTSCSWNAAVQIFPWAWDSNCCPNPCSWFNMNPLPDVWRPHWGFIFGLQPPFNFSIFACPLYLLPHWPLSFIGLNYAAQSSALLLGLSDEPLRLENQWLTDWMNEWNHCLIYPPLYNQPF